MIDKEFMLKAPDGEISDFVKESIKQWAGDNPTALQLLHTLDMAVYTGGASTFVMKLLNLYLDESIKEENTTFQALVEQANWRDELEN